MDRRPYGADNIIFYYGRAPIAANAGEQLIKAPQVEAKKFPQAGAKAVQMMADNVLSTLLKSIEKIRPESKGANIVQQSEVEAKPSEQAQQMPAEVAVTILSESPVDAMAQTVEEDKTFTVDTVVSESRRKVKHWFWPEARGEVETAEERIARESWEQELEEKRARRAAGKASEPMKISTLDLAAEDAENITCWPLLTEMEETAEEKAARESWQLELMEKTARRRAAYKAERASASHGKMPASLPEQCVSDETALNRTVSGRGGRNLFRGGEAIQISWATQGSIRAVNITLFKSARRSDVNRTHARVHRSFSGLLMLYYVKNTGHCMVHLPMGLPPGADYLVEVSAAECGEIYAFSRPFGIDIGAAAPAITVTSPTYRSRFKGGEQIEVKWVTKGSACSTVSMWLCERGEPISLLQSFVMNTGSWRTTVPRGLPPSSRYCIWVQYTDGVCQGVRGSSDPFAIDVGAMRPAITVTSPSRGATYEGGQALQVRWAAEGTLDAVNIDIFKASNIHHSIASAIPLRRSVKNTGHCTMHLPMGLPPGADYVVQVSAAVCSDICAYSSSFGIDIGAAAPAITVTSPTYRSQFKGGEQIEVKWVTKGSACSTVSMWLCESEEFVTLLQSFVMNTGSWRATVPRGLPPSSRYRVQVYYETRNLWQAYLEGSSDPFAINVSDAPPTIKVTHLSACHFIPEEGDGQDGWEDEVDGLLGESSAWVDHEEAWKQFQMDTLQ
eukprot:gene14268-16874_t